MFCPKCYSAENTSTTIDSNQNYFCCLACGFTGVESDFTDKRPSGRPRVEPTCVMRVPVRFKKDIAIYIEELKRESKGF